MDVTTQLHLAALRAALVHRRSELRAEVRGAELARRPAPVDAAAEVADLKDLTAERTRGDVAQAEEERDVGELAQVDAALARLDEGRYGECLGCGEPIPFARLFVQPAAPRCASCQAVQERRGRA